MSLLELYDELYEDDFEKFADDEELEVIYKYAELADDLLASEFGDDYDEDDVADLAVELMEADVEYLDELEKVAELEEAGIIMAHAFLRELGLDY